MQKLLETDQYPVATVSLKFSGVRAGLRLSSASADSTGTAMATSASDTTSREHGRRVSLVHDGQNFISSKVN